MNDKSATIQFDCVKNNSLKKTTNCDEIVRYDR